MKKVGIFAGSFDPIHDGHLEVMKSAHSFLELDELLLMIEEKPWNSKKPIDISHRKNMAELALRNYKNFYVLDINNKRFDIIKTLPHLENNFIDCELYFIFGADVFININDKQWPGLENLLKHYIVVFERRNITEKEITAHAKSLGIVVAIIPSAHPHHSSTDVRLKPHDKKVWVPKKVAEYIDYNNLYHL